MTDSTQGLSSNQGMTHVISQGGFSSMESHRKRLASKGITAAVICPPGVDTNG